MITLYDQTVFLPFLPVDLIYGLLNQVVVERNLLQTKAHA